MTIPNNVNNTCLEINGVSYHLQSMSNDELMPLLPNMISNYPKEIIDYIVSIRQELIDKNNQIQTLKSQISQASHIDNGYVIINNTHYNLEKLSSYELKSIIDYNQTNNEIGFLHYISQLKEKIETNSMFDEDYDNQISNLEDTIDGLQSDIEELDKTVAILQKENTELKQQVEIYHELTERVEIHE